MNRRLGSGARRFLYEVVAGTLRQRIKTGVYPADCRIPPLDQLVSEFNVSTITVRRALRDLAFEGLLVARQGLGVFAADPRRIIRTFGATPAPFMGDEIRKAGYGPAIDERGLVLVRPSPGMREAFGLAKRASVYRHEKTVLADGEPVALDVTYLRPELLELIREDRVKDFLFSLLASRGVSLGHVDFRFHGAVLTEEEGRFLGLPRGYPALAVSYTAFGPDGRALLIGRQTMRSDRFIYEFCGRPEGHADTSGAWWFPGDESRVS